MSMRLTRKQLNGDHEGLKQKWNDLKKALE